MLLFLLVVLFSVDVSLLISSHDDILSDLRFGEMDLLELERLHYEVEISTTPIREEMMEEGNVKESSLMMISRHGQRYSCILPDTSVEMELKTTNDDDDVLAIADLLQELKQQCLITNTGWWTYKYCHGNNITQFHLEGDKIVSQVVYVGHYDTEEEWTENKLQNAMNRRGKDRSTDHSVLKLPSHDVTYVNGSICQIINKPRSAHAKLTCSPFHSYNEIIGVVEEETCNYTFVIHSPLLCDHPLFVPENKMGLLNIQCSPVLSEKQYNTYMKSMQEYANHAIEQKSTEETQDEEMQKNSEVPLVSILEMLTNSIIEQVQIEFGTKEDAKGELVEEDDEDNDLSDKDLDEFIDKIVSDSLNKAFGIKNSETDSSEENSKDNSKDEITTTSIRRAPKGSGTAKEEVVSEGSKTQQPIGSGRKQIPGVSSTRIHDTVQNYGESRAVDHPEGSLDGEPLKNVDEKRSNEKRPETISLKKDLTGSTQSQHDKQNEEKEKRIVENMSTEMKREEELEKDEDDTHSKDPSKEQKSEHTLLKIYTVKEDGDDKDGKLVRETEVSSGRDAVKVLSSILEELLTDGFLDSSDSVKDRKERKKQEKLEEHYDTSWDLEDEDESS